MKVLGLHHLQVTVPSAAENEARRFYLEFLGLQEMTKPESLAQKGGFWARLGEQELHVGIEDGFDRRLTKAHPALLVDDLEGWRRRLKDLGCEIQDSVPVPGLDRFEFRDPFGNRIEMLVRT